MYAGWKWAGWRVGDPFLVVGGESVGIGLGDKRSRKDQVMNRWASSGSNLTIERTSIVEPHTSARATSPARRPAMIRRRRYGGSGRRDGLGLATSIRTVHHTSGDRRRPRRHRTWAYERVRRVRG